MKIFVLGSNGMLGRYVYTYLKSKFTVIGVNRNEIDASCVDEKTLYNKLVNLGLNNNDVIINCIGTIKPMIDSLGDLNGILVNSVFPRLLSNVSNKIKCKLIHPTTDCVYSGSKGGYDENDKYDVSDVYGMSKAIGEPSDCMVIRTSIIGEEVNQSRSLVEWVKKNEKQTVNGFTNHLWNGITCLQFAKICENVINNDLYWVGTKHIYSNVVNKKELVELISHYGNLNITVLPVETENKCDRTLTSKYPIPRVLTPPPLNIQIKEMFEFSNILNKY